MIQLVPFWNRFIWKDFERPTLTIYFFALKSDKKYSLYTFFQKKQTKKYSRPLYGIFRWGNQNSVKAYGIRLPKVIILIIALLVDTRNTLTDCLVIALVP